MFPLLLYIIISNILTSSVGSQDNPHIIYILIDDLGWANVQYHNDRMQTPNLMNLLPDSLILNDFYVFKYCSPSRSALLSGRISYHVNEKNGPCCATNFGLPVNMTTISEKLVRQAGYIAHQVGKWHLGMSSLEYVPVGRGFTSSLGYLHADEDHWTQNFTQNPIDNITCSGIDLWETKAPGYGKNGTYGGFIYSNRAMDIINQHNKEKPLFLYLATQNNHAPLEVPQQYIDKFNASWYQNQRTYAAMTNFADEIIGNVTKTLKENKMWNNTLLFISSDNGGPEGSANNHPYRGGKFTNFQGGIHAIALVSGGYLPKERRNMVLNQTIHIADIYATICSVVGIDPTDERAMETGLPPIDSINQWPLIIGDEQESQRNEFMLQASNYRGGGGLISGDYKIIFGTQSPAFWVTYDYPNGTQGEPQSIDCGNITNGGCLFNIKTDPTEHFDVINYTQNTALVQQLRERYIELSKTAYIVNYTSDPNCCAQIQKNGGYWGPWINYSVTSVDNIVYT